MNKLIRNRQNSGITLIALVVTIVVLVILAAVAINIAIGNNGLVDKTKQASKEQYEAQVKEKVENILTEYVIEKESTSKDLLVFLQENNEIDEVTDNKDGTYTIQMDYFEIIIDVTQLSVINITEYKGIKITAKIDNTTGWVKSLSDGVVINGEIKAIDSSIVSAIILKDGTKLQNLVLSKTGEYSYTATTNGIYKIEVLTSNNINASKEIKLDFKEDSISPNAFTPTATSNDKVITISAVTTDNEGGSGIDYYEYSVKKDNIEKNTNLKSNVVTVEEYGTFEIKVIAYDKTGNKVECTTTIELEDPTKYFILKKGVSLIDRTGTWIETKSNSDSRVSITYSYNTICIKTSSLNRSGTVKTTNYFDLTQYNSLKIDFAYTGNNNNGTIKLQPKTGTEETYTFSVGETSKTIDISHLSGEYNFSIQNGYYTTLTINSIYFSE